MLISFGFLLVYYTLGYFFLWKMMIKKDDLQNIKLLELGTLSILFSDLLIYTSLFQADNTFSNLIWLGFYLLLIALFYMLGKRSINHFQTNKAI